MLAKAYFLVSPAAVSALPRCHTTPHRNPNLPRAVPVDVPITKVQLPNASPPPDDPVSAVRDYRSLFASQPVEVRDPIALLLVDGALPPDFPSGTYYLTGPGIFADDHGSTVHPLDGHGYLRSFRVDAVRGKVEYMARYVETEALADERDGNGGGWRFKYRGPFSVLRGERMIGNTKVMKNVANTSVLRWGERLFCLWEGGDPYEFEPATLATVGKIDVVGGRRRPLANVRGGFPLDFVDLAAHFLKPILYGIFKMPEKRLLAHYKIDVRRKRLLIMATNSEDMLLPKTHFTVYEFDNNFNMLESEEFVIFDHLMIHDWTFTDSHYIIFGNRIKLHIPGSTTAICGITPMITALSLNPSKSTTPIYLLPRKLNNNGEKRLKRDWSIPIEAPSQMWVLHVANAYEERDDVNGNINIRVQASGCSYQWFEFQKMFGYDWRSGNLDPTIMNPQQEKQLPHLVQVNITMDAQGNCQYCNVSDLNQWNKVADFPVINQNFSGEKNTCVYAATTSGLRQTLPYFPFDSILKLNLNDNSSHTWYSGERTFIGEPIFVPKVSNNEGEQDGYILVVEYAVALEKCFLAILDSRLVGKKNALMTRFEIPTHLRFPLGFHGFWA